MYMFVCTHVCMYMCVHGMCVSIIYMCMSIFVCVSVVCVCVNTCGPDVSYLSLNLKFHWVVRMAFFAMMLSQVVHQWAFLRVSRPISKDNSLKAVKMGMLITQESLKITIPKELVKS